MIDHDQLALLTALSGPGGVLLGVTGKALFDRIKTHGREVHVDASAVHSIADAAVALVEPLRGQIADLTSRVEALEAENDQTKAMLQLAISHIQSLRSWIAVHLPGRTPPTPPSALGLDN